MAPLEHCHVIDLSLLLPGPLATQILRDLGAKVTKVEPPYPGDYLALWPPMLGPVSGAYFALNRGKQIVEIDLKSPRGLDQLAELVRNADVVVEGFRPGVIDKLGFGFNRLQELNPKTILCSISGFGQSGPYKMRAGHDLGYQAMVGVLSLAGQKGLFNPPLQVADTAAGSYAAAMLVMAALLERDRTGMGRHIDVSMAEQLLPLMTTQYASAAASEMDPTPDGELLSGAAPCYRIYRTADGHQITLGALEPKFWLALIESLGLPELASAPYHGGPGAQAVIDKLTEVFATKTRDQWAKIFSSVDACVEPVRSFSQVCQDPHWQHRKSFIQLQTPDGRTAKVPKMPGSLAGFDTREREQ